MKKKTYIIIAAVLCLGIILGLAGCGREAAETVDDVWAGATYTADTELGSGEKTFSVEVAAEEKSVNFTVHTDKSTVGDALLENDLISGDAGEFGMYVKVVNGITADYDVNQTYWAFYVNGEYASSGVDTTEIAEGTVYRLEYTR